MRSSKRPEVGVDFAAPEPISTVLPRIQLTDQQANELWALARRGYRRMRKRGPVSRGKTESPSSISAEVFKYVELSNAVQWAMQFYVRDRMFSVDIPQLRRRLRELHRDVGRLLTTLPEENDLVGYFLKRTYTGKIFLIGHMRPSEEQSTQLEQAWLTRHGCAAIGCSLLELQRNIEFTSSLLSGTRPKDVPVIHFIRSLAHEWEATTGQWPKSGRDDYKNSGQSGPFANFVRAVNAMLPPEFQIPRLDHAIRSACTRNRPSQPKVSSRRNLGVSS